MQRLQSADKFLGALACVLLQPLRLLRARTRPTPSPRKILLVKFWGIGSLQLGDASTWKHAPSPAGVDFVKPVQNPR